MRWLAALLFLAGCGGGELVSTTTGDLCPDLRIDRTWTEPDVSRAAPIGGVAVTAHHLTFMRQWNADGTKLLDAGKLTEIWELADGTKSESANTFLACNGQLTVGTTPAPYAIVDDALTVNGTLFLADR